MTKLNSISISNVRRFSEDVTLNISTGATIILAPNGTGKTSIFEAIELALTGAVKRLNHPPDALIRDGLTNAKIRLNFDTDSYCEALFTRGVNPKINIQHESLFGKADKDNIPFLLRLTHLLNQNSKDWFVQSNGPAAAQQLDSLAIGKDAQYVYNNITSLKRSTTLLLDNVQKEFSLANDKLEAWASLLNRRSTMTAINDTGLIPKKDLIKRIQDLNTKKGEKIAEQVPAIMGYLNQVDLQIAENIATIQNRLLNLESLKSTIQSYIQVSESLLLASNNLKNKNGEIQGKQGVLDDLNKKIDEQIKLRDEISNTLSISKISLSNIIRFNEASLLLTNLRQNLAVLNDQLISAISLLKTAESIFQEHSEKNRIAKGIQARKTVIINQKNDLLSLQPIVDAWKQLEITIEEQRTALLNNQAKITIAENDIKESELKLNSAINAKKVLEDRLTRLTETSDTIKQAVTVIVSNLSEDEKTCPVCLNEYKSSDLQDRMRRALSSIGTEISPVNEALQKSKEEIDKLAKILKSANDTLGLIKKESLKIQKGIDEILSTVSLNKGKFTSASDSNTARLEFERRLQETNKAEEAINKELSDLKNVPSDTELASVESDFQSRSSSKTQIETNIASVNKQIEDQNRIVSELQSAIKLNETKESLEGEIFKLEQNHQEHEDKRKEWAIKLSQEKELLSSLKTQLISIQTNVQTLDFRKSELLNSWHQLQLEGEPNNAGLEKAQKDSESHLKKIQDNQESLRTVSNELVKWQAYDEYFQFEAEIKTHRGEISEEVYTSTLQKAQEVAQQKLTSAQTNNEILVTFSKFLDEEIQTINTRLEAINPTLGSILKRLTVDPRFAQTNVSSFQHYKKNHAEMKVPLHGGSALVSHVASEAQITDVQFSFLLAMAQTYQWSPWKALLLDDPTQHHDLVHASSVFDILRDYIVDQGFQVVLATHDSVQAKFFMRKLENDGIPCSLYNLRSTELGVIAEAG